VQSGADVHGHGLPPRSFASAGLEIIKYLGFSLGYFCKNSENASSSTNYPMNHSLERACLEQVLVYSDPVVGKEWHRGEAGVEELEQELWIEEALGGRRRVCGLRKR
jgi:hypothetical protein